MPPEFFGQNICGACEGEGTNLVGATCRFCCTVRGEPVQIIGTHQNPTPGILGATVAGANVLVQYPDGERGYVRQSDISDSPALDKNEGPT